MEPRISARHYVTFDGTNETHPSDSWADHLRRSFESLVSPGDRRRMAYSMLRPPLQWELRIEGKPSDSVAKQRICRLRFDDAVPPALLEEITTKLRAAPAKWQPGALRHIGADLRIHVTDFWNPFESLDPIFGTRRLANELMCIERTSSLHNDRSPHNDRAPPETPGVNVVIIDQGLSERYIEFLKGSFAGGWRLEGSEREPGQFAVGHGSMLARNVLSIAPNARIFDFPLIPKQINNLPRFLSDAHAAFLQMIESIAELQKRDDSRWKEPWILVNSWAAYDRSNEHPAGHYTNRPEHNFNELVGQMALRFDMVFAAGNCGEYCPSALCGPSDVGPGRSITGANSHPDVLTVGAVRADGLWLAYSSEGPGTLPGKKPDLCAASQFSEDDDGSIVNTGTSAACAIAAGIVAALRTQFPNGEPAALKDILIKSTAQRPRGGWDPRLGNGIINLAKARRLRQMERR